MKKTSLTKDTQCDLLIHRRKDFLPVLEKDVTERNQDTDEGRTWVLTVCLGWQQCFSAGPFVVYPWRIATHWVSTQELCRWRWQHWVKSQLLAAVVGRVRKTQKEEKAWWHCTGKRNKTGPKDQRYKAPGLKNPLVTFTVTETSIVDLVNVEGSMDTTRWFMIIIHAFAYLSHRHL